MTAANHLLRGSTDYTTTKAVTGAFYPLPVKKGTPLCIADGGRLVPWWANMPMGNEILEAEQRGLITSNHEASLSNWGGCVLLGYPVGSGRFFFITYGTASNDGDSGLHLRVIAENGTTGALTSVSTVNVNNLNSIDPVNHYVACKLWEDASYHYFWLCGRNISEARAIRVAKSDGTITTLSVPNTGLSSPTDNGLQPLIWKRGATTPSLVCHSNENTAEDLYAIDLDLAGWTIGSSWTNGTAATLLGASSFPTIGVNTGDQNNAVWDWVNETGYFFHYASSTETDLWVGVYDEGTDSLTSETTRDFPRLTIKGDEGADAGVGEYLDFATLLQVNDKAWKLVNQDTDGIGFLYLDSSGEMNFRAGGDLARDKNQMMGGTSPVVTSASSAGPGAWGAPDNDIKNGIFNTCMCPAYDTEGYIQTSAGLLDENLNVLPGIDGMAYFNALVDRSAPYGQIPAGDHFALHILEKIDDNYVWCMLTDTNSTGSASARFFRAPAPCLQMTPIVGVATSDSDDSGNFNAIIFEALPYAGDPGVTLTYDSLTYPAYWIRGNFDTRNLDLRAENRQAGSQFFDVPFNTAADFSPNLSVAFEHGIITVEEAARNQSPGTTTGEVWCCGRHLVVKPSQTNGANITVVTRETRV